MLWILASLFFFWCAFREIRSSLIAPAGYDLPQPITKPYLGDRIDTRRGVCLAPGAHLVLPTILIRQSDRARR
jgi:hypothetical protein